MHNFIKIKLKSLIELITDYHANGSYKILKSNVTIKYHKDYAIMIRTLNFEQKNFYSDLIYVDEKAYNFLSKSKVFPYDILINKIANPGSVYMMPDINAKITCGMNLFLIRFSNQVDQIYMYYHLKHNENKIKNLAHGTTTKTITKDDIRDFETIIHSDIKIQNIISALLHNLDKLIEKQNLIYSELEKMAKTLYDYWFVQFDFPDENGRPYKSSGGKMVWNNELKKEIPYGWEVKKLKDLVLINKNKSQPDCNKFLLDLSVMPSNSFCLQQFSKGDKLSTNIFTMQKFDILFGSIRPYLLKAGFAPTNGLVTGTIHSVKPIDSNLYNYLLLTFCSNSLFNYAIQNSKGSRMPVIGIDDLLDYKIALNKNIMYKFEKSISFKEIIANIIMENQELILLRDFLLPLLMNGQAVIKE